jgi:maltose/maltodextrin transport system substrate-binding protein
MIETYWAAFVATQKEVYKAKALSIANNFTRVQREHGGDYPTMFTKYPMNFWVNNSIYPARVMMTLQKKLDAAR